MLDIIMLDKINMCKNVEVPTRIVQAIISVESNYNPLAINVNKLGKKIKANSKEDAIKQAKKYMSLGYTVDLGIMQFNSKNFEKYPNYSVSDMFDVCKNIKVASEIYHNNYIHTTPKDTNAIRILKSLSMYNTGGYRYGFVNGYVYKYKKYLEKYIDWQIPDSLKKLNSVKNADKYANYLLKIKASSGTLIDVSSLKGKNKILIKK